jgi:hypothetical protein
LFQQALVEDTRTLARARRADPPPPAAKVAPPAAKVAPKRGKAGGK